MHIPRLPIIAVFVALLVAPPTRADELVIEVHGLKPEGHTLYLAIYDDGEKFNQADARKGVNTELTYKNVVGKATSETMRFRLDIPHGFYGLKAFYDIDGDKKLGSNFLGIPNEPYGFSNDARGVLSQPTYEEAEFEVEGDATLNITLK